MLQTLLKVALFFAMVLAASLAATRLAETGRALRVVFDGVEYTLGPVQAAVAVMVIVLLSWLVVKLLGLAWAVLRFIMGDETALTRWFRRSRERKGYAALGEGMLAVASGEGRLAQDQARRAAKYLDQPHVTNVLAAQAAEVAGDAKAAEASYRAMLDDDRTRFVGVRGLLRQRLDAGDTATALKLAEKAYALKPRHVEVQDTLLQLQTQAGEWKGARGVLKDKRRAGLLPQDVHIRRDAILALQEASAVLEQGASISAREAAISASRASPDLIPAAVLAARSYIAQSDPRNASRVLQKTWSVRPHPEIAAVYAEIVPDETPAQRRRRFDDLLRQNANDPESVLLRAELALADEDFPGARKALGTLAETDPTVRSLSIMAAVERGSGASDTVVRGWLAKALTAPRGPQWVCDNCHNVMPTWSPTCDSCSGFDTLTWRRSEHAGKPELAATGTEMLPLLVGPPAPEPEPAPAAAPVPATAPAPTPVAARPVPEQPKVAPGMVPRERDWSPAPPPPASSTVVEITPVRPDVDPPETAPRA